MCDSYCVFLAGNLSTNEIKEIFKLFDKQGRELVNTSELGTLVRALNLNPTEDEINAMKMEVDGKNSGSFNFESLEHAVRKRGKDKETLQDLIDALRVFDTDHDDKITIKDFKHAMQSMGEKMDESDIDEIIADSDLIGNQYIEINEFAKMIMNRI